MLNGQYFREAMRLSSEQTSVIYLLTYVYIQLFLISLFSSSSCIMDLIKFVVFICKPSSNSVNNLVTLFSLCPGMQ